MMRRLRTGDRRSSQAVNYSPVYSRMDLTGHKKSHPGPPPSNFAEHRSAIGTECIAYSEEIGRSSVLR
jgi:hypothetical protein